MLLGSLASWLNPIPQPEPASALTVPRLLLAPSFKIHIQLVLQRLSLQLHLPSPSLQMQKWGVCVSQSISMPGCQPPGLMVLISCLLGGRAPSLPALEGVY